MGGPIDCASRSLRRDTSDLIGTCGVSHVRPNSCRAAIGWHLSSKFSGAGYATEAAREMLRFAFQERHVMRVRADCFESNLASRRVLEKLGMRLSIASRFMRRVLALTYAHWRPVVRYTIENRISAS